MEKILILDDDEFRHKMFSKKYGSFILVHAYTAKQAINLLKLDFYNYIFLDHDLGGRVYVQSGKGTGYEVAVWIADNYESYFNGSTTVYVHSLNPVGAQNIKNVLQKAVVVPGLWQENK